LVFNVYTHSFKLKKDYIIIYYKYMVRFYLA
jgi:hypothetical protein